MLDLAISIDTDPKNTTVIETNHGVKLRAPRWPQDCDFQLVAFDPWSDSCEIVPTEGLAGDIRTALITLDSVAPFKGLKPDWYRRLELYATDTG
jgi:hypothetical protein